MSVNLGPSDKIVFIGDYDVLKEVLKDDKASSRGPQLQWFNKEFRYGNGSDSRGLLFSQGDEWSEQRRFSLRKLRDFGMGKSSFEDLILDEVKQLCEEFDSNLNQPFSLFMTTNISVLNALWTIVTGKRSTLDDKTLLSLSERVYELFRTSSLNKPVFMAPSLRHAFPGLTGWTDIKKSFSLVKQFVDALVEERKNNFNDNATILKDEPNDFIDAFLAQISNSKPGSSFNGELGHNSLKAVLYDLLIAGVETTSTSLSWAFLFMIRYPEWQDKVRNEIVNVVGTGRQVCLADRANLHVTEATIQEILRCSCIAPLSAIHYSMEDIYVAGFKIPKGTTIMPNLHRIMMNPVEFPEPGKFNPGRFLNEDGIYQSSKKNIPFGIGKRDCLGKSLAINQLFLFFSGLIQRFKFKTVFNDVHDINMKGTFGFLSSPPPYEVIMSR